MLSPEEYRAFEEAQRFKWEHTQPQATESMSNYERWQVTRYDNNLGRYFVTARHELGTQFKTYVDRGRWQGGREFENRMFEELQYHYRNHEGIRVTRTSVTENCKLFEVTQYGKPLRGIMIVDGDKILDSVPHTIKEAYRYRMISSL